jgi:hypothetical protein
MQVVLLMLAAIHLIGMLIVLVSAVMAPFGYEDEEGFHANGPHESSRRETTAMADDDEAQASAGSA